jgi:hypothetical protein
MRYDRMHHEAVIEMTKAAVDYERATAGLGREFLEEVRVVVERTMKDPQTGFLTEEDGIRLARTKRFPYSIMFDYTETPPFILTVYHQHRDPEGWKTRIKKRNR